MSKYLCNSIGQLANQRQNWYHRKVAKNLYIKCPVQLTEWVATVPYLDPFSYQSDCWPQLNHCAI